MSALDWILLTTSIVTALYWYLTRHHDYWKSVGVSSLPGVLPGVGNMWDSFVLKASSGWQYSEFYRQFGNQPAIGIYNFRNPALLLKSPNLIQEVLIKEFSSFHDNLASLDPSLDVHMSKNPFVLKGDSWKKVRQQINPAFSPLKIKAMFPLIQMVCNDCNKYLGDHENMDIDVSHFTGLFTSEVVAKCAFGLDGNAFTAADSGEFYKQGKILWDGSVYDPIGMLVGQYFPIVNKILCKSFVPKEVTRFFVGLVAQTEEYRKKNPENIREDYLQFLLNLKMKDTGFTIDDVVAQSLTFFSDGFETSSVVASFLIHELTLNPNIQEALRHEVKSMPSFSYDNIVKLDLLDRVVKETLRKYPVFSLSKVCTKDHILKSEGFSYPLRQGHEVILPAYAIHYDPEHYPNPEKFDPDRFLPDAVKNRHPMTYLGFGGGPRMCIGYRFATNQIKILIADLLANFRLVKCEKTVEVIKLSPTQIMPVSEKGIWCRFQKL